MPQDSNGGERESLLSILRRHRAYYFWTFVALTLAWITFAGWWQVEQGCLRMHWAHCVDRVMPSASGAMPFILPLTVALADMEVWLVRGFQLVFLNLPETREERLRREVREDTLREARQEAEKQRIEALREARQEAEKQHIEALREARQEAERRHREAMVASNARYAAWYARMKEAQEKAEPFDEPPPWEQQARMR